MFEICFFEQCFMFHFKMVVLFATILNNVLANYDVMNIKTDSQSIAEFWYLVHQ